jgi:hypothetical protein
VPSYLILVPMLVLLPPGTVPLFTAAGLVLASGAGWLARRASSITSCARSPTRGTRSVRP